MNFRQLQSHFVHGREGRQLFSERTRRSVIVQLAVKVNANQVKGIAQEAAGRVRTVVGVGEKTVFIYDQAAGRGTSKEGVAVFVALLIDLGQKLLDRVLHRIGPAECADNSLFL